MRAAIQNSNNQKMKKKRFRYQTVLVSVPNASPAGQVVTNTIVLDRSYDKCTGVGVSIGNGFAASGNTYVDCGLTDPYGTIFDDCHIEQFQANAAVAPDNKFLSAQIKNSNQVLTCRVIPPLLTTSAFTIQFRFRLEDDDEVVASV